MKVQAELSLYPLRLEDLSEPIERFREALAAGGLCPETGNMSTVVGGEIEAVFDTLKSAFAEVGRSYDVVLVVKVSNACPSGSEGRCRASS